MSDPYPVVRVGDRVKFSEERLRYTVRAVSGDGRFVICTKPFNPRRTVLYSIIDFERGVRGPDDLVFCLGYETDERVATNMGLLEAGEIEVSYRRCIPLSIDRIDKVAG